ncbi:3-carboxy-cis,cis-muconate cycloisomerase [Brevibacterium sanguinis]|uniref:3-carboxy-cis,cis-muconate cycloisomerase n=2 Tax=Brevibacterium TaxID=1696 RepID=A0A366IG11_9MICO|nr:MULTISPECIES: lyase family protein [Brevibacterium]RBP62792.1 3-carboxy-cis,cis-muconate cycloisomerase [Brevibacterium sanguinis]RBP69357.1 3-carboxy-cis,cis-muconate cycloisomerase [Brevibacterium celere]
MSDTTPATRSLFAPGDRRGTEAVNDLALVAALGEVETAWVESQARTGLITEAVRAEAIAGIESTIRSCLSDASGVDDLDREAESGGNPVIPFLRIVRNGLGAEASRALHRGLTSQDVVDSAIGLLVSRIVRENIAVLGAVCDRLAELSTEHASTLCLARTLTQPALPTTFGLRAANWAAKIHDVLALAPVVEAVQIGGAAGTRAAIRELAGESTEALLREFHVQLRGPDAALTAPPPPWHGNRGRVLHWGSHLAQCVAVASTIARDILVGARPEIGEITLAVSGGSSAMPHKLNPTSAVLLHRNGMRAPGALSTLASAAAEAVEERSDGAWHAEWPALAELLTLARSSLSLFEETIDAVVPHPEAMRRNLDAAGPGVLSERLSIVLGDRVTKEQLQNALQPGSDPAEELERALGGTVDREEIDSLLDPANYLGDAEEIRRSILQTIGGPSSRFTGPGPRLADPDSQFAAPDDPSPDPKVL